MRSTKYVIFLIILYILKVNIVYAEPQITCVYENGTFLSKNSIECTVTSSKVTCTFNKSDITNNKLRPNNYLNGSVYDCRKTQNIHVLGHLDGTSNFYIKEISPNGSYNDPEEEVYTFHLNISKSNNDYFRNPTTPSETNPTNPDSSTPPQTQNPDTEASNFCNRNEVKGAFRTIGWVIFAAKIAVPIIIIVLGSIDFGKAVIANKDDEIKKSAKSLIIRVIAGFVIFLLPTILNFAIKFIGGEKVYDEQNGSFGYCTYCMLNPTKCSGSIVGNSN